MTRSYSQDGVAIIALLVWPDVLGFGHTLGSKTLAICEGCGTEIGIFNTYQLSHLSVADGLRSFAEAILAGEDITNS